MAHNCTKCGQPIVLVPSALERSKKYGETPQHYINLFRTCTACIMQDRHTIPSK